MYGLARGAQESPQSSRASAHLCTALKLIVDVRLEPTHSPESKFDRSKKCPIADREIYGAASEAYAGFNLRHNRRNALRPPLESCNSSIRCNASLRRAHSADRVRTKVGLDVTSRACRQLISGSRTQSRYGPVDDREVSR
jgi:hypothetical protein